MFLWGNDIDTSKRGWEFGLIPAVAMIFGSCCSWFFKPGKEAEARCQRFSAGLLIGAAICDIFPLLNKGFREKAAPGAEEDSGKLNWSSLTAALIGFVCAMVLMNLLSCIGGEESDSEDESGEDSSEEHVETVPETNDALPDRAPTLVSVETNKSGLVRGGTRDLARGNTRDIAHRRWSSKHLDVAVFEKQVSTKSNLPIGLIVAVLVDSAVDGMLIGMAAGQGFGSGILLAWATAIEMGFLGFSFTVEILSATRKRWAFIISLLPPLTITLAAWAAGYGAEAVRNSPVFEGMLSFSLVAVLFMVFEELLVEASEAATGWHISLFLYLGLFMSVVCDVAIG